MNWIDWMNWKLMLLGVVVVAMGCSSDDGGEPTIGSESHFLQQCEATRDCANGLACHCGICTSSCADDQVCSALGQASCVPTVRLESGCAASVSWAESICVARCAIHADCNDGMFCSESGWCQRRDLPAPGPDAGDADIEPSDTCQVSLEASPQFSGYGAIRPYSPYLSQGSVYYTTADDPVDSTSPTNVYRFDVATGDNIRVTDSTHRDVVRAAADGTLVLYDPEAEPLPVLSIYDEASQTRTDHERDTTVSPFFLDYAGAAPQFFDGRRLLIADGDGGLRLMDVDTWQSLGEVALSDQTLVSRPVLTPYGFAYAARSDNSQSAASEIYLYGGVDADWRTGTLTQNGENNRYPYADGDDLYWVSDEAVYVAKNSPNVERIHEGRCGPPHASHGRAAFVCADSLATARDGYDGSPLGDAVFVYDGQTTRKIASLDGDAFAYSARISEHGVMWVEYVDPRVFCGGSTPGKLMYYDLEYDELLEVDALKTPFGWCDDPHQPDGSNDFGRPFAVSIEGNFASWNYSRANFGFTTIERSRVCPQ